MSQEVYAEERLRQDLIPKEVVLYQYEACPFCNKVKGEVLSFVGLIDLNLFYFLFFIIDSVVRDLGEGICLYLYHATWLILCAFFC